MTNTQSNNGDELRKQIDKIFLGDISELEIDDVVQLIQSRERAAVDSMHGSIMQHELVLGSETDQAFNYARIHRWIDKVKDQLNHEPNPQAGEGSEV